MDVVPAMEDEANGDGENQGDDDYCDILNTTIYGKYSLYQDIQHTYKIRL